MPHPRASDRDQNTSAPLGKRWYSPQDVAQLLGYGIYKVRMLLITGEMRSIKDGKYRRVCLAGVGRRVCSQAGGGGIP